MPRLQKIIKRLTMTCAKCMKDKDKLAWFFGNTTLYNESLLCRICFKESFNKLTIT